MGERDVDEDVDVDVDVDIITLYYVHCAIFIPRILVVYINLNDASSQSTPSDCTIQHLYVFNI